MATSTLPVSMTRSRGYRRFSSWANGLTTAPISNSTPTAFSSSSTTRNSEKSKNRPNGLRCVLPFSVIVDIWKCNRLRYWDSASCKRSISRFSKKYVVKHTKNRFVVQKMAIILHHKPETIFFTLEILPIWNLKRNFKSRLKVPFYIFRNADLTNESLQRFVKTIALSVHIETQY